MSWLYSIVLAGLMFSSGGDPLATVSDAYTKNNINKTTKVILADETERFEQTYPLNANGRVSVSNINGSITVEAWDRSEVKLEAVKIADSKETLSEVEIQIDAKADYFSVETNYDNWKNRGKEDWNRRRKLEVQFHLMVPRGAILNEIETVNGSVAVSNFTNQTRVSAVNGQVTATNLRGAANLSTVNGTVTVDFDSLVTGSRINLSTVNGQVNLAIPSDASATVKADSVNGNITNDFGLPVRKGKYVGRDLYGKLGSGDVQIKLDSVNGGLAISRKKDGKNPGAVVDLLPQKAKDDDDWDDNDDDEDEDSQARGNVHINTDKMNKHIERGVKEAEKAAKAIKVNPVIVDIPKIDVEGIKRAAESIDTKDIENRVRESMDRQRENFARMRESNWEGRIPVIDKKTNSFPVKGVPKVTIEARGCRVKVSGWDKQEVRYEVTRITSNRAETPLTLADEQTNAGVSLKVENKDANAQSGNFFDETNQVFVEVFVPKKSDLRIVTNGEIRLENVTGEIDLSGGDEAINVRDVGGRMHLASEDARVRIIGFDGDFDSQTNDGDVYLEGNFTRVAARANDGTITLTVAGDANASFASNTEIETDGIDLTEVKEGNWRLGAGGLKYNFTFSEGKLIVRRRDLLDQ
jgi:Putative adhesin